MSGHIQKNEYPKASNGVVFASLLAYIAGMSLLMALASPYWIESYPETHSNFKNMGLWEYCFKEYRYPYYQLPKTFDGCHSIFSHEYYVIREWLLPGWLMAVQTFVTISFILTFFALSILSMDLVRWPLQPVLKNEWLILRVSSICFVTSSILLFLAVAVFGGSAYRRDWLMYPKFNVLSWSYALAVVAFLILGLASLILHREAQKSYEIKSEAKNLVMQIEMQKPGYQTPRGQPRSYQGYI